jgi:transposase
MKHLTILERTNIIILYEKNKWSSIKIAKELKINIHTVLLWINRYKKTGTVNEILKSGRFRKTSKINDLKIIETAKGMHKSFIIDEIREEIKKINIYLCNNTIINRLKEYGFYCSYPFSKPLLTEEHKRKRLEFALNNYDTDWTFVIFSDETSIVKGGNFNKKIWVGPEIDNVVKKLKHQIKRHLYGCISIGGIETFKIFKENLNSEKYKEILDETLKKIYNNNYLYQQDNSPIHKSKKLLNYFNNNNIKILENWPPNSPDLNPIENLWFLLKYKLLDMNINNDNFNEIIEKTIKEIKYEHIFNMISSMQIRICKVIQKSGDYIDY